MARTASRRLDRSARSMATTVWTPAPIMWRRMRSIFSHRRRRDVAKPVKSWGLKGCRRMQGSLLPFHIVASILSWLPVKSLLRFRCVCKEWRSLTYNPRFIKEHDAHARTLGRLAIISTRYSSPKVVLYDFGDNGEVRPDPISTRYTSPKVLLYDLGDNGEVMNQTFNIRYLRFGHPNKYTMSNSVNGLIWCKYRNSNRCDVGNHYLLNPATRELAKLPRSGNGQWDKSTGLGLGVDSATGGYKLVELFHIDGRLDRCGCKVLELGTQEWRIVGRAPCRIPFYLPVLVNGALHWIAEMAIAAFDLKDENFRLIPVPPKCRNQFGQVYVVEWEGLLCLVTLPYMYEPEHVGASRGPGSLVIIWRLEDYATGRWREAHYSQLPKDASIDGEPFLVGIRGHEMLLVIHRGRGVGSICSYDLLNGSLWELDKEYPSGLQFLTESLVSPRYLAGSCVNCSSI